MTIYDYLYKAIHVLNEAGIEYFLAGSFSSMFYSFPRTTTDADIVIQLNDVSITKLVARMGSEFRLDPQMTFETLTVTTRHVILIPGTPSSWNFFCSPMIRSISRGFNGVSVLIWKVTAHTFQLAKMSSS